MYKDQWEEQFPFLFKEIVVDLIEALPDMQPRWCKGMAAVLATHAIVSTFVIKVNQPRDGIWHCFGATLAMLLN